MPTQLEKYYQQIDCQMDEHGNKITDWKYSNYFIQMMRNVGAHIFMNCEASSVYPHRQLLEDGDWQVCFNDWTDLMCMARVGKNGSVKQIAGPRGKHDDAKARYVSWAIFEFK